MSIKDKLNTLAEGILDSLRTTEVQLPLFGVAWACASSWFPATIPASVDITPLTAWLPGDLGGTLPGSITPGWLIICLPLILIAKTLTPGRIPFVTTNVPLTKLDIERDHANEAKATLDPPSTDA